MKWFKHFADNHRGISIRNLMNELGHSGLCYYILMEMCAEKLEHEGERPLSDDDCVWNFDQRLVRQNLRLSCGNVRRLLDVCATNGLLSWEIVGSEFRIEMPILLKLLDRDSIRARKLRANAATKPRPEEDKDKEEEYIKEKPETAAPLFNFETFKNKYPKPAGPKCEQRFREQIKTLQDAENLGSAIKHYLIMLALPENAWRSPKATFATFLGSKSSGYFWEDFISPESCKATKSGASPPKRPEPRAIRYPDVAEVMAEQQRQREEPAPDSIGPPMSTEERKANLERFTGLVDELIEKTSLKKIG